MTRTLCCLFTMLAGCTAPGTHAAIRGPSESCALTSDDLSWVGFVDDGTDGVIQAPPGDRASGSRFPVEVWTPEGTMLSSERMSMNQEGLLEIDLSRFPTGRSSWAVRKKEGGLVLGEGHVRRVSGGSPALLCAGIADEQGQTQSIPTDGTLRVFAHDSDGLRVELRLLRQGGNPFFPDVGEVFSGSGEVSGGIAVFENADPSGYPEATHGYAILMDGDLELDRIEIPILAPNVE